MSKFLRQSLLIFIIKGFQTIVFIFIVISTTFPPICPPAFFRCLSNSGTFTELRTTSFIESTGVAKFTYASYAGILVLADQQKWHSSVYSKLHRKGGIFKSVSGWKWSNHMVKIALRVSRKNNILTNKFLDSTEQTTICGPLATDGAFLMAWLRLFHGNVKLPWSVIPAQLLWVECSYILRETRVQS